eukprot:15431203-Alexandrium_andersonii.AAC.1
MSFSGNIASPLRTPSRPHAPLQEVCRTAHAPALQRVLFCAFSASKSTLFGTAECAEQRSAPNSHSVFDSDPWCIHRAPACASVERESVCVC